MKTSITKIALGTSVVTLSFFTGIVSVNAAPLIGSPLHNPSHESIHATGSATTGITPKFMGAIRQIRENSATNNDTRNVGINAHVHISINTEEHGTTTKNHRMMLEMNTSLRNLDTISARVATRIAKDKVAGKNTANAEALYATATLKLAKAHTAVSAFIASQTTNTAATGTMSTGPIADIRSSISDARQALRLTVNAIVHEKSGSTLPTSTIAATTTASTSNQ